MKIQIRKELTPSGWTLFPYEWDGDKWVRLTNALVVIGPNGEEEALKKCQEIVLLLKYPQSFPVTEYELDDDGVLVSPTE